MHHLSLKLFAAVAILIVTGSQAVAQDIKEFVGKTYVHGVPYEEASKYNASVVPTLLQMLKDPGEQNAWSNIVTTLGMIGDKSALEPMIAFIEKEDGGTVNRARRRAQASAVVALGYLIKKSGSRRALDYLIMLLNRGSATGGRDLSKYAVMGLGLSGHPKAAEALKSLQDTPERSSGPRSPLAATPRASSEVVKKASDTDKESADSDVDAMIREALEANKKIADEGLEGYHRESH